ncbi:NAD(P)H-hydrate dehydratase [Roseospira navarrensis]|uniref:Bifunctional NAD(P)H-hydrate repair enzyme n=2 Tax=Roseospira navarrensis TaxID=140058 RepID=A0A7X2D2U2_9PROT|nr:NAD(P)H-hydrate dehydratase [Roseospira navarrensis]MQX36081.1 NAD(P)H-hydrate dehydratase [Roseospira navarrensis]
MQTGGALLTVAEMGRADALAVEGGVPSLSLMEHAGFAATRAIRRGWMPRRTVVLCGPGNNGGDGFVIARMLRSAGWPVTVHLLGDRDRLKGDAAVNAGRWHGPVAPLDLGALDGADLVVDALFGAGLSRPVDGVAGSVLSALAARPAPPVVAVDVPSGLDGDTGQVWGTAAPAALTVTFFRPKPGHVLGQGPALCGDLAVSDIGIPATVLDAIGPAACLNGPALWSLPRPGARDHKYTRGHAVVFGGATMTGAGRLAARAARRMGAGLLSVAAPSAALPLYAQDAPGVLCRAIDSPGDVETMLEDARLNALLLGPGAGRGPHTAARVLSILPRARPTVLDADALTSFADDPGALFEAITGPVVMTPHEGEFRALFPDLTKADDPLVRVRAAAARAGAVVLLKGPRTIIAAPDGRAGVNTNAPAALATAGSGDVLAGAILGLLAQGMPAWEAAAAAAWLHGAGAHRGPPGLIAEDLPDAMAAAAAAAATPPDPLSQMHNGTLC